MIIPDDDYGDTVVGYGGSVMTGRQGRLAGREEREEREEEEEEEEREAAAPLARLPTLQPPTPHLMLNLWINFHQSQSLKCLNPTICKFLSGKDSAGVKIFECL